MRGKLEEIRPTERIYYPVLVTLRSGEQRDAVYMAPAIPWFEMWGVWPGDDQGKNSVSLSEVIDLVESPSRLPSNIAGEIYEAGESGMGYCLFQLKFSDGSIASFGMGNAIDFPDLPPGTLSLLCRMRDATLPS